MLWLAAASGLVAWEARRRTKARNAVIISEGTARTCGVIQADSLSVACVDDVYIATRSALQDLKHALSCLQNTATCADSEEWRVEQALLRGHDALPWLCNLLEASEDAETLSDAAELMALLSPSRHGLQTAIYEAGAVPGLLRLLASPPQLTGNNAISNSSSVSSLAERSATGGRGTCSQNNSRPCSSPLRTEEPDSEPIRRTAEAKAVANEARGRHAAGVPLSVLAVVLRTLVNLTSSARGGTAGPVRQAVLGDCGAIAGLLQLLRIKEWGRPVNPSGDGDPADHHQHHHHHRMPCTTDTPASSEPFSAAESVSSPRFSEAGQASRVAAIAAPGTWQVAGLAAWLVAHLCSSPVGQLQLVREGVVPLLVRLVQHGRLVWRAFNASPPGCLKAPSSPEESCAAEGTACGRMGIEDAGVRAGGGVAAAGDRSGEAVIPVSPTTKSRQELSRTGQSVTSGGGTQPTMQTPPGTALIQPSAVLLQFVLSAVQYSLMALVNITFDNSAHQRIVAVAGGLEELQALFDALLSPGVLGLGLGAAGGDMEQEEGAEGSQQQQEEEEEEEEEWDEEEEEEDELGGSGWEEGRRQRKELGALLRSCSQSVAKFAVWLLAHLSSSDPDLKFAISGPAFGFIPKLLSILTYPPTSRHPAFRQSVPTTLPGKAAASTAAMLPVRQYSAMALVNLTCGVPSTKAEVAAAMDWTALAAQLQCLADTVLQSTPHPQGPAASQAAAAPFRPTPAPPSAPLSGLISDLLLYTVWLVQHVSLSPVAVANTDPTVVGPLVALLTAPDPHVRLRTVATLGALCSCPIGPDPPARKTATNASAAATAAAATGQDADSSQGKSQQAVQASPRGAVRQGSHREAFLAAGGIEKLLAVARAETDARLLAYDMLCLSAAVGDDDADAVAAAVGGGALGLLERLMASEQPACLIPAAEALQAVARAAGASVRHRRATSSAAAFIAEAGADHVPRSLLSRMVSVMLTHTDPRVRVSMNDTLGSVTALPGVRDRYCAVFAETLRVLVSTAEVELQVIPVN